MAFAKVIFNNIIFPTILLELAKLDAHIDWVDKASLHGLIHMPQFKIDSRLMNLMLLSYNEEKDIFTIKLSLKMLVYGTSPLDVKWMKSLPDKEGDTSMITSKAIFKEYEKKYLESHYNILFDEPCKLVTFSIFVNHN